MIASVLLCPECCTWVTVQDRSWSSRSNELGQPSDYPAAPNSCRALVIPQRRVWSAVGSSRSAEPEPLRPDYSAVSNLYRARVIPQRRTFAASRSSRSADSRSPCPRHRSEVVAGRLKTENWRVIGRKTCLALEPSRSF